MDTPDAVSRAGGDQTFSTRAPVVATKGLTDRGLVQTDNPVGPDSPTMRQRASICPLQKHQIKGADPRTEHGAKRHELLVGFAGVRWCLQGSLLLCFLACWWAVRRLCVVSCRFCFARLRRLPSSLFPCDGRRLKNRQSLSGIADTAGIVVVAYMDSLRAQFSSLHAV